MEILGYVAAVLTTISFVPQAWKSIKEKNTEGISLAMYSIFTTGVLCWLIYGFVVADIPIIIANFITGGLAIIILGLKLKYK